MSEYTLGNLKGSAQPIRHGQGANLSPLFGPTGANGFPLGLDSRGSATGMVWNPVQLQGHALTFGATRSGKGVSAIIPALLTYAGSMVVIDPKGENAWVTAERRRQMGNRVVILDPWNEVNRRYGKGQQVETPTRFNPLSALRADDPDFSDDVGAIADALVVGTGTGHEAHWTNSARELLAGLMAAEVERNPPGTASLRMVRRMVTATEEMLVETVNVLTEANPDSLAGRKLRRFTKYSPEIAGIRSTADTQTAVLDAVRLVEGMETDEEPFDLAELATGRVTLYLVLPPDRLQTHGRWLRMVLTLALRAISRQPAPPELPVVLLLDELGTISPGSGLMMIEQAFGLLAGLGIRVWGFFQDLNQLQRDYPASWGTFISNSALIQVLNARDKVTSEYFADFLGTMTMTVGRKAKTRFVPSTTLEGPGSYSTSPSTEQQIERPVMTPDELRRFDQSKALILRPGDRPVTVTRLVYHQDSRFRGLYRELPGFETPPEPEPVPKGPGIEDKAAELASQGLAAGKAVAGKAAGWAAARFKDYQQRQTAKGAPPTPPKPPEDPPQEP